MTRRKWISLFSFIAIGAVAVAYGSASAAKPTDLDLLHESTLVVDATVGHTAAHWDARHRLIFTTVNLEVMQTIASTDGAKPARCSVEVLGGEVDGVGLAVAESPRFVAGDRVVVFARRWADGLCITRGEAGVLRVDRAGLIENRGTTIADFVARLRALAR